MSPQGLIILAVCIPLAGAVMIALAGRLSANLRETVTLLTSVALIATVWSLLPGIFEGSRPSVTVTETLPGISIAFRLEPLGEEDRHFFRFHPEAMKHSRPLSGDRSLAG